MTNHLRRYRLEAGLTQQALATKAKVALRTVQYIEGYPEEHLPQFPTQGRLLKALGVAWDDRHDVFPVEA